MRSNNKGQAQKKTWFCGTLEVQNRSIFQSSTKKKMKNEEKKSCLSGTSDGFSPKIAKKI